MGRAGFLLTVITAPGDMPCEAELLEALLVSGLERLHIRKPGGAVEGLLKRLAPRWAPRLVAHASEELAGRYGVGQVHGAVRLRGGGRSGGGSDDGGVAGAGGDAVAGAGIKRSTSVHSWDELKRLPEGLEYAFISPVFDSISKPGYRAGEGIFEIPAGPYPCRPVGLGGISVDNVGLMVARGWKGAALLGGIWEAPAEAVVRFEQIKKIVDG